ncbi:dipeptidase PepE [Desulfobotulus sp. H1]|uniref:Dipeptidase PepE n=1 Tax=Desulfobotulus pelophilus TaxID=2823377 RepID=A0ABT3N918_9BACT|nr:dipeptidase PepE [Desulfobotulus pelophilus]MCW7753951.1 dipeptidase PepE [Desulfobotulus pelophilus]
MMPETEPSMRLLLLSNSGQEGFSWLGFWEKTMAGFLGAVREVLFIPFAAPSPDYDAYEKKLAMAFAPMGILVQGLHRCQQPLSAMERAEAIVVGGGNTHLLRRRLHDAKLLEPLSMYVKQGTPYLGWSAGANLACPTIATTNDMPIVDHGGLEALDLVPFQINPHYTDAHPPGHRGETRSERIQEYLTLHPRGRVLGLREGSGLLLQKTTLLAVGQKEVLLFTRKTPVTGLLLQENLSFLLEKPVRLLP